MSDTHKGRKRERKGHREENTQRELEGQIQRERERGGHIQREKEREGQIQREREGQLEKKRETEGQTEREREAIEEARKVDDDEDEGGGWAALPDLLLERVFSYLSMGERYAASQVCRGWFRASQLAGVWRTLVVADTTLSRRRFNYYYGWQHVLDHLRAQMCLLSVGRHIRHLIFKPMTDFQALYEFVTVLCHFAERRDAQRLVVGPNIRSLSFTFHCHTASEEATAKVYGTGGRLLQALKRLMGNLGSLRHLELIDLMLDVGEAQHLLDEVCALHGLSLRTLAVVNTTGTPYQLLHVGVFLNLQVLVISPQNLGEDVVQLLGYTTLRHLHLVQNHHTPVEVATMRSVTAKAWHQCRRANPHLAVHLELVGVQSGDVVWQDGAPVHSIVYDSPHLKVTSDSVLTAVDLYHHHLTLYAHRSLPRYYQPKSFHERADSLLLLLCRQCPYLHTLVVRERISTATVLLVAHTASNLRHLVVRRNAVVLRCDWPWNPEWSTDFYEWLHAAARSYDATEQEVSRLLGRRWLMLSDRQFKLTALDLHRSHPY